MWSPSGINIRSFTFYSVHQWYKKYLNTVRLYVVCRRHNYPIFSSNDIVIAKYRWSTKQILKVSNWFKANKMSINATKTNYMIIFTPKMTSMINQTDVVLDNTKLDRVTKTKFLGVIINENLTWKNHIDGITKTISRNIGMINKVFCSWTNSAQTVLYLRFTVG